jgi:hypothetical protein
VGLSLAAVHELNKANEFSLGTSLRVSDKYKYSDLDELIVSHIKQMALKVTEMMAHDKFRGTQEELSMSFQVGRLSLFASKVLILPLPRNRQVPSEHDHGQPRDVGVRLCARRRQEEGRTVRRQLPDEREVGDPNLGSSCSRLDMSPPSCDLTLVPQPIKVVPGAFSLFNEDHGDVMALVRPFVALSLHVSIRALNLCVFRSVTPSRQLTTTAPRAKTLVSPPALPTL